MWDNQQFLQYVASFQKQTFSHTVRTNSPFLSKNGKIFKKFLPQKEKGGLIAAL